MAEHRIQTLPPATAEEQAETHYFDDQLKRALRISSKIRNAEPFDIQQFSGHSSEIGTYFKTEEFQRRMSDFMRDWRYGARRTKRSPIASSPLDPLEIERVRRQSRDHYGTPRAQVDEETKQRREHLVRGGASRTNPESHISSQINLAQDTARAKWRQEHPQTPETFYDQPPVHEQPEASHPVLPPIGRRSPKRLDTAHEQHEDAEQRQALGEAGAPRASRSFAWALDRLSKKGKMRVCEFAEELGVENQVVMDELEKLGVFVRSPDSTLKASVVHKLIIAFRQHPDS
ncbi:translation initiation factor IF-2 N-terminal domain-containing protein [Streptomyces sp. NPDC052101]|uniref:translation initiation factor IF-2 N-terminal domain-containing protein n=1 Tax=Streptomyces sp. NPDC052101 TaxID=3155763 RepID=UPI00343618F3